MPVTAGNPITQADLDALSDLANSKLLPIVNRAITANENNWGDAGVNFYGGVITSWYGLSIYDIPSGTADGIQPIKNPQPEYKFDITTKNWADELNRIRGDVMALIYGNGQFTEVPDFYQNPDCLVSGPWVVGVNDPVTWDLTGEYAIFSGVLPALLSDGFSPVKNVEFWCLAVDATGISMNVNFRFDDFSDDFNGATKSYTSTEQIYSYAFNVASGMVIDDLILNCEISFPVATQGPTTVVATGATVVSQSMGSSGENEFFIAFQLSINAEVGDNPISLIVTFQNSGIVELPVFPVSVSIPDISITGSSQVDCEIISPISTGKKILQPQYGTYAKLNIIGTGKNCPSNINFSLSDGSIIGAWIANTLPVPGQNVFLDQDLPPFVGTEGIYWTSLGTVATSDSGMIGINVPVASSMRESAPAQRDYTNSQITSRIKNFGLLQSSMAARPTPYLVLRDTDFVPFDYGFNIGESNKISQNEIASADGSLNYHNLHVGANVTAVRIRAVKAGTGRKGWKNGVLQYGDALATPLNIYVAQTYFPTTSAYDFGKTDSTVTIEPDGGAGYLATILNNGFTFGIGNTSGTDEAYDLVVETDTVAAPNRQYFPACNECFSYVINGTPRIQGFTTSVFRNKPIPQNGYCIFKLRATRLPGLNGAGISVTPTSGDELVVTIGQNKLQLDNTLVFTPMLLEVGGVTPFTVTIPADGRDSGDVAVFWPVLGGNEIVYQCDEQVMVEAWVNWQPIFFNSVFALGPDPYNIGGGLQVTPDALAFQYALGFINYFDIALANYPAPAYPKQTFVQFPISVEIYNDLWELLDGMTYPGPAGGAGGSGGAGGGGGAGGAGGGGGL